MNILFDQTKTDVENLNKDSAGCNMIYDDFKKLCRKAWNDDYKCRHFDKSKNKKEKIYCICSK